uniref:hypothetical protein n=1 Tax=Helicobacter typhlonius TaxID=76936 RepID=UPI002FE2C288
GILVLLLSYFTHGKIGMGGVLPVFSYRNLQDFIRAASPISACYYCYGSEGEQVTPGAQMTKQELAEIK